MPCFKLKLFYLSVAFCMAYTLALAPALVRASDLRSYYDSLEARYTTSHSLGNNYVFDPRDGWTTVNATDMQYKYLKSNVDVTGDLESLEAEDIEHVDSEDSSVGKRSVQSKKKAKGASKKASSKSKSKAQSKVKASGVTSALNKVIDSLKGIGRPEPVTITWYTGHDLENPSCWSQSVWTPTDASFVSALTLDGWESKPQCFKFLELCNTPKKCVFVRVVDSCAGCAKGSKHVDLTQAAFKELATLDTGLLTVQMRQATDPEGWLEHIWGPKD